MQKALKCLILEDSVSDQLTLEMILADYERINIKLISTPEQFLHEVSNRDYKLFMIDINLESTITGIDLAHKIPNESSWVIFCSASDCDRYYGQYKNLKFKKFYLQKPIDEFNLRTHLDTFLTSSFG